MTGKLEPGSASGQVLCPFDLRVWDVDRMLNFEIADNACYEGLELQVFDDPVHGRGMIVLLKRRGDGRFDIYRQPGLTLDTALAQVGGELGSGARRRSSRLGSRSARAGSTSTSASRTWPVGRSGCGSTTGTEGDGTRERCSRRSAPVAVVDPRTPGDVRFDGASNRIESLQVRTAGHRAGLVLQPALPDVARLQPGASATGAWRLDIDSSPAVVGGTWTVERRREQVDLVLDITRGWTPRGLPPLMAAVTRVAPVFRTWPTTYRWSATITLRDQSYRRLTTARPR